MFHWKETNYIESGDWLYNTPNAIRCTQFLVNLEYILLYLECHSISRLSTQNVCACVCLSHLWWHFAKLELERLFSLKRGKRDLRFLASSSGNIFGNNIADWIGYNIAPCLRQLLCVYLRVRVRVCVCDGRIAILRTGFWRAALGTAFKYWYCIWTLVLHFNLVSCKRQLLRPNATLRAFVEWLL